MPATVLPESSIPAVEMTDDSPLFEIIDGKRVELPPLSSYAVRIANRLKRAIDLYSQKDDLGEVFVEQIFNLRLDLDRNRRPDVAFVSRDRWPNDRPHPSEGEVMDVVPELMVEVISPNDKAEELQTKIREYFEAGAKQVWVIYPRERFAHICEGRGRIQLINEQEERSGGDIIPGFRIPLAQLFPPTTAPASNGNS